MKKMLRMRRKYNVSRERAKGAALSPIAHSGRAIYRDVDDPTLKLRLVS